MGKSDKLKRILRDYFKTRKTEDMENALRKLGGLIYEIGVLDYDQTLPERFVPEIARIAGFESIAADVSSCGAEPNLKWLGNVLVRFFGCKSPVLKKPQKDYVLYEGEPPEKRYLSTPGLNAFTSFTSIIYSLEELLGESFDAETMVCGLDEIRRGEWE